MGIQPTRQINRQTNKRDDRLPTLRLTHRVYGSLTVSTAHSPCLRLTHRVSWRLLKSASLLMYSPSTVGITMQTLPILASSPPELPVLLSMRWELLLPLPLLVMVELLLLLHPPLLLLLLLLLRAEYTDPLSRAGPWWPGPTLASWISVLHTRMFVAIRSMSCTQCTAVSSCASGPSSVLVLTALFF